METVKPHFYVDDCLKSVPTKYATITLDSELSKLLIMGGLKLWLECG